MTNEEQTVAPPVFQPDDEMMAILDKQAEQPLEIDAFDGREEEVFTIIDGETEVPMTLVSVERLKKYEGSPCQNPGSLLFRVVKNWEIPQRLYRVRSEGHSDIVLFLAMVAPPADDSDHNYLETVFN